MSLATTYTDAAAAITAQADAAILASSHATMACAGKITAQAHLAKDRLDALYASERQRVQIALEAGARMVAAHAAAELQEISTRAATYASALADLAQTGTALRGGHLAGFLDGWELPGPASEPESAPESVPAQLVTEDTRTTADDEAPAYAVAANEPRPRSSKGKATPAAPRPTPRSKGKPRPRS